MIKAEQARRLTNVCQELRNVEVTPLSDHIYSATRSGHDHIERLWDEEEFNQAKKAGYFAARQGAKMIISW